MTRPIINERKDRTVKSGRKKFKQDFDKMGEYYDELYGLGPEDIAYYVNLAKKAKGKVLELPTGSTSRARCSPS